jgi:hypothetical protein
VFEFRLAESRKEREREREREKEIVENGVGGGKLGNA